MKRIFISGPITRGDLKHNLAQASAAYLDLIHRGYAPLCPHLSAFCDGSLYIVTQDGSVAALADKLPQGTTHKQWVDLCLAWIEVSDAVLRLPGLSTGADQETAHAREKGIPVYSSLEQLRKEIEP
jgi:hypothetical protein